MTNALSCGMIYRRLKNAMCECSSMVEFQPSKLVAWVRFPSLAPIRAHSSVDRVPGYEPVGRRFESSWARHKKGAFVNQKFLFCLSKLWLGISSRRRRGLKKRELRFKALFFACYPIAPRGSSLIRDLPEVDFLFCFLCS